MQTDWKDKQNKQKYNTNIPQRHKITIDTRRSQRDAQESTQKSHKYISQRHKMISKRQKQLQTDTKRHKYTSKRHNKTTKRCKRTANRHKRLQRHAKWQQRNTKQLKERNEYIKETQNHKNAHLNICVCERWWCHPCSGAQCFIILMHVHHVYRIHQQRFCSSSLRQFSAFCKLLKQKLLFLPFLCYSSKFNKNLKWSKCSTNLTKLQFINKQGQYKPYSLCY